MSTVGLECSPMGQKKPKACRLSRMLRSFFLFCFFFSGSLEQEGGQLFPVEAE